MVNKILNSFNQFCFQNCCFLLEKHHFVHSWSFSSLGCMTFSANFELNRIQYMLFVFLLIMLEAGVTADIFFNRDWEEDFPEDPSGSFDQFKGFIRSSFQLCKWIGLSVVHTGDDFHKDQLISSDEPVQVLKISEKEKALWMYPTLWHKHHNIELT
uniref:Uncharacterized protein n=1 Tax=Salix viminalis TaxID=40686 RepID=A0A6N2M980_SALVM